MPRRQLSSHLGGILSSPEAIILRRVDFPAPFGPTRPYLRPCTTLRERTQTKEKKKMGGGGGDRPGYTAGVGGRRFSQGKDWIWIERRMQGRCGDSCKQNGTD